MTAVSAFNLDNQIKLEFTNVEPQLSRIRLLTCLYEHTRYRSLSIKEILHLLNLKPTRRKDVWEILRQLEKDGIVYKTTEGRVKSTGYRLTDKGTIVARTILETEKSVKFSSYIAEKIGKVKPGETIIIDRKRCKINAVPPLTQQEKKELENLSEHIYKRYVELFKEKMNTKPKLNKEEIVFATIGTQSIFYTFILKSSLGLNKTKINLIKEKSTDVILKSILDGKCDLFPVMPEQTLVKAREEIRGNDDIVVLPWAVPHLGSGIFQGTEIHWVKNDKEIYYYPSAQRSNNIKKIKKIYNIKAIEEKDYELDPEMSLMVASESQVAQLRDKSEKMRIKAEHLSTHDRLYIIMRREFFDTLPVRSLERIWKIPLEIPQNKKFRNLLYMVALGAFS